MKFIKRIIEIFKRIFNIPNTFITCDPAEKDGDYSCFMKCKVYPDGLIKVAEIKYSPEKKEQSNNPQD